MDFEKLIAQLREKMNARISLRNEHSSELETLRGKETPTERGQETAKANKESLDDLDNT